MKKQYEFAGVELEIFIPDQWIYEDERLLKPFQVNEVKHPHQFHMEIVQDLAPPEGMAQAHMPGYCVFTKEDQQERYIGSVEQGWQHAYMRVWHHGYLHKAQLLEKMCESRIGVKSVLNALAAEHLVLQEEGVIFHCAYVAYQGKAILFTAPSETGKSTQANLWATYRSADIINGDRGVIRLIDGEPYACGIPFAGSSKYCKNVTLPIAAIVYLGQAEQTSINRLDRKQAFRKVWEGCTVNIWNEEDLTKAVDIVQQITEQVPAFYLQCTPDETAVIALEKELVKL